MGMTYLEWHARTAFSFLRAGSTPEKLFDQAAQCDLSSVAVCDRNGFYGSVRSHERAVERGICSPVGVELMMEDEVVLPLIVKTRQGYRELSRLLTRCQLRSPKGDARCCWDELGAISEEVVVLTGGEEGVLEKNYQKEGKLGMEQALQKLLRHFPKHNVRLEMQRHHLRHQVSINQLKRDLAYANRVPLLATNGVCYADEAGREILDVLTSLREHRTLDDAVRNLSPNGERRIKSPQEMMSLFTDLPEAILETERLQEQVSFSLENLGYEFPRYSVPEGHDMGSYLADLTWKGARERYSQVLSPKVKQQIKKELRVIKELGFCGYFLIVWSLVRYCRESDILVQGRGSAANSAVCYCLGITPVDPIASDLLFERFLSEGRKSWPDIDLDLPSGAKREQVIQEVYRRYGRHGAAMTANVICYRGRSSIREVGKALDFSEEVISRFSDIYGHGDFEDPLEFTQQASQAGIPLSHPRFKALQRVCENIQGHPRHLGQHSGGMVICQGGLDTIVPIENASMEGRSIVQWDKNDCDAMGIIKVDLLGLGMMAALEETIKIAQSRGKEADLVTIPKDDQATYDLMCRADTVGVFQVESRAQMNTLRRMQPRCFYDVVIEVAIVRPGPIAGNLAHPYLNRRHGKEPVDYIHPDLTQTLERTLGVPMFQEQVLKMAIVMAGFSGSEAEELRKAMGFQRSHEKMVRVERKLRYALAERKVSDEVANKIVQAIGSFALYGFPESHAISFGMLAYASCYFKVHFTAEFFTALLNQQPMGFYAPATLIQDAKRHGLQFLPPDVTESQWICEVIDDTKIRLGLLTIKGVVQGVAEHCVDEREKTPFVSLQDFRSRTRFCSAQIKKLAKVGALRSLTNSRRTALWQTAQAEWVQGDLFADQREAGEIAAHHPLPEMNGAEELCSDFEGMRLTVGDHPMAMLRPQLPAGIASAATLLTLPDKSEIEVVGSVICRQRPSTAKGVLFITLEDETGLANIVVYSELFAENRLLINTEAYLRIRGIVQRSEGTTHIIAHELRALPTEWQNLPRPASYDFR